MGEQQPSPIVSIKSQPWDKIIIPEGFMLNQNGVYLKDTDKTKIADPVWVSAHTHNEDTGAYGLVISFIDRKGKKKEQPLFLDAVHERGKGLAQLLAKSGLYIAHNKEGKLHEFLNNFEPQHWARSVTKLGWLDSKDGKLEYLVSSKDGIISNHEVNNVIFQPEAFSPTSTTIYKQGTLEEWKQHVAEPCRGNPYLVFAICTSLAGILLKHSKTENGGFHFYGRSSRGKTTLAQVAATVFGCGADPSEVSDQSFVQRWNSTSNALEGLLAAHNDSLLVLDEIASYHGKDFGRVIYNIVSGKAKARMSRDADLKAQTTWRTLILSTGEISAQKKIEEYEKVHAGQLLRLLDIPTHEAIIKTTHGSEPEQFALNLKQSCAKYFGVAGSGFIKTLIRKYSNSHTLRYAISEKINRYSSFLKFEKVTPEQLRALRRFALVGVAGEMAVELGVLPFSTEEIKNSIQMVAHAWLTESSQLPDNVRGCVAVQQFILANPSRFRDAMIQPSNPAYSATEKNLAGYKNQLGDLYWFLPDGFAEACGNNDVKEVARELRVRGILCGEKDRFISRVQIHVNGAKHRVQVYAISGKAITEHEFYSPTPFI